MTDKNESMETGHVICLTHWDREWQIPICTQRRWLVQMMDTLLDVLDAYPGYTSFLLDGQSVLVEDYLVVRPENTDRLVGYIRAGRIQIGPWYTLPDEFPVDGECLVRSLLWGCRISERYGGCMHIGLTTFGWGQTAQLPQIYAGFGVDTILIGKGINQDRIQENEFLWQSPDGSTLLTSRFGDYGRANFFFNAMLPIIYGQDYLNTWQFHWDDASFTFHRADDPGHHQDHFTMDQPRSYNSEMISKAIKDAWYSTRNTLVKQHRFLGNGTDFSVPDPRVVQIVEEANALFKDRQLVLSSLPQYVAALKENIDHSQLRTVVGELRDGPPEASSANALAIRPQVKRRNRLAQNSLLRVAEPLAAITQALGGSYPKPYLEKAWQYLMKAQPHDSINGVTQDKTSRDVLYRLDQVLELAEMVADLSIQGIVQQIDLSRYTPQDVLLVLFNPLPYPRQEVVKVWVDTPSAWDSIDFSVEDPQGNPCMVQPISRTALVVPVRDEYARPCPFHVDRHAVYLDTGLVPACGYTVLRVVPERKQVRHAIYWPLPEEHKARSILVEQNALENEYLYVTVQPNGTLDILDKATNQWHRGLHYFEDGGDIGDFWVRRRPGHDQIFTTLGANARISSQDAGSLTATLVTEITFSLPARADKELDQRSPEIKEMLIRSEITLRKGAPTLEILTTFDNLVEDHRLRVLFPTDLTARFSHAEGHFTVDKRPTDPSAHPFNGLWPEMWLHPQQAFVDLSDDRNGMAFINDGLCEYEVIPYPRHTLALSLLRSVRNEICSEFRVSTVFPHEKGGQSLEHHEFRYAIYFHQGNWEAGQVHRASQRQNTPITIAQVGRHAGTLPVEHSFFAVEPAMLVLNAMKKAEECENLLFRLHNPTESVILGQITSAVPIESCWLTSLNEVRLEEILLKDPYHIQCEILPGKIITIEAELRK